MEPPLIRNLWWMQVAVEVVEVVEVVAVERQRPLSWSLRWSVGHMDDTCHHDETHHSK